MLPIVNFLQNLLRREPLKLVDGGEVQRTFLYIKDAIEAVVLMIVCLVLFCIFLVFLTLCTSSVELNLCFLFFVSKGKPCSSQRSYLQCR
jgi:hypothetical protein